MLRMAAEDGTTDIVATPHSDLQYRFDYDLVTAKIEELNEATAGVIRIHRGCDFHLHFDNIQDALNNPTRYTINNKCYLLVEFSELLIAKTSTEVFYRMESAGMIPIITHPERNPLLQKRLGQLVEWVEAGVMLQVTAGALLGRWGRDAKAFGEELIKRNLAHFIASDAHDTEHRPPKLSEARAYVARKWGEHVARTLFEVNPGATLTGAPIELPEELAEEPARWYQFWR